jgi:hypothetical protein
LIEHIYNIGAIYSTKNLRDLRGILRDLWEINNATQSIVTLVTCEMTKITPSLLAILIRSFTTATNFNCSKERWTKVYTNLSCGLYSAR